MLLTGRRGPGAGAHLRAFGKGRKERIAPLTRQTVAVLKVWMRERAGMPADPLFPTRTGNHLSRDALERRLAKHLDTARERCPTLRSKPVSMHTLRHTAAMMLLNAGVDTSTIALWLGRRGAVERLLLDRKVGVEIDVRGPLLLVAAPRAGFKRRSTADELTELGQTLDDLFGRLEASFEAQRHFVANASHELRTPVAGLQTLLEVTLADPDADNDALRAACQKALALGQHQERLVNALLILATSERGIEAWEPFDLAQITQTVLTGRHHEADNQNIQITTNLAAAPATGDPKLVELLIANLIENAVRHNHSGGKVEITTTTQDGRAILAVTNTGPRIPDQIARVLQPFQRLGKERVGIKDGHGLGLAIVGAIVAAHSARLSPRPRPDGGLDIEVSFLPPRQLPTTTP